MVNLLTDVPGFTPKHSQKDNADLPKPEETLMEIVDNKNAHSPPKIKIFQEQLKENTCTLKKKINSLYA